MAKHLLLENRQEVAGLLGNLNGIRMGQRLIPSRILLVNTCRIMGNGLAEPAIKCIYFLDFSSPPRFRVLFYFSKRFSKTSSGSGRPK